MKNRRPKALLVILALLLAGTIFAKLNQAPAEKKNSGPIYFRASVAPVLAGKNSPYPVRQSVAPVIRNEPLAQSVPTPVLKSYPSPAVQPMPSPVPSPVPSPNNPKNAELAGLVKNPNAARDAQDSVVVVVCNKMEGTGTFVAKGGYILTAAHILVPSYYSSQWSREDDMRNEDTCGIYNNNRTRRLGYATVLFMPRQKIRSENDMWPANDFALLKIRDQDLVSFSNTAYMPLFKNYYPDAGQTLFQAGYGEEFGDRIYNLTVSTVQVESLFDGDGDPSLPEIAYTSANAASQAGSSGGPLFHETGRITGIYVARNWTGKKGDEIANAKGVFILSRYIYSELPDWLQKIVSP